MQIQNILVPIDFSDCSKNALRFAIQIAKTFKAKIHMVNAVHVHAPHPNIVGSSLVASVIADYEAQVIESFKELEKEEISLKDVPHEADRFLSYLIDAIYTETVNKKIDLIVMGTRSSHTGLEQLLGSRATDIVATAKVPVLIIPEKWVYKPIRKIAFAFDLNEKIDTNHYSLLNELAKMNDSSIMGFSIKENGAPPSNHDQTLIEDFIIHFDKGMAKMKIIEYNSIIEGIKAFAESQNLDMIALIPKEHTFLEKMFKKSITKHLVLESTIPLLALKE
jgi:nucleotide-binding universal stress UspA family protein